MATKNQTKTGTNGAKRKPIKASSVRRYMTKYKLGEAKRLYNKERDNRENPTYVAVYIQTHKGRELIMLSSKALKVAVERAKRNPEDAERTLFIEAQ